MSYVRDCSFVIKKRGWTVGYSPCVKFYGPLLFLLVFVRLLFYIVRKIMPPPSIKLCGYCKKFSMQKFIRIIFIVPKEARYAVTKRHCISPLGLAGSGQSNGGGPGDEAPGFAFDST